MKRKFECRNKAAVCGHRGDSCHGAENTIAAMKYAADLGVDMIETDVRMSADGNLFLMHNLRLEDLTDGTGVVREHSFEELRKMNAARDFNPDEKFRLDDQFQPIALLDELLDLAADYPDLMLNIELKDRPSDGDEEFAFECADKTARVLAEKGFAARTWINSFSGKLVERICRHYGTLFHYHGFFPWTKMGDMVTDPSQFCDVVCMLNWTRGEDGRIMASKDSAECFASMLAKGIAPLTVTFPNDLEFYDDAVEHGSRILMADDPAMMLSHCRAKGWHD
jgi:glycerophosphoryl diester phosphodiesterase